MSVVEVRILKPRPLYRVAEVFPRVNDDDAEQSREDAEALPDASALYEDSGEQQGHGNRH
jgi:hypothetical protein